MNEETIKALLESVQQGSCSPAEALLQLKDLPYEDLGFARLDHHRALRTGQAEVIFCQGKQPDHIISILTHLGAKAKNVLATILYRLIRPQAGLGRPRRLAIETARSACDFL